MRLRSIEIKGFKSFADKTIINFQNNITGIVGPNGCGKSNVVDSIRWVLGEQKNKALRLEKMENIIFNGSKDKAASNLAEVSLTLDNTKNLLPTEFQSVTITRSIDRDGDSTYKLNGVNCRLKDIRDLFLDTGISTDSYAIIELKMIDQILNNVDNARRTLLEQAAGISKYKTRKKETLLKLNATEADLNRVEDLLFEIDKNLKQLETQAKKTRQYKAYKEEYKVISLDVSKYELHGIHVSFDELKQKLQSLEDQKLEIITKIEGNDAQLEKEKLSIIDKEKHLSEQQKLLNSFLNSIQENESKKKIETQKLKFLKDKTSQLQQQIQQSISISETLTQEINQLANINKTDDEKLNELKLVFDDAKEKLDEQRNINLDYRNNVEKVRNDYNQTQQQIAQKEKVLAVKENELLSLERSAQQSLFENEERIKNLNQLNTQIESFDSKINTQKSLVEDLVKKEELNEQKIKALEEANEQIKQELTNNNRILDAKNNEYKLTKNMIDNLEGFPESIKFLKKNVNWLKETPLLSDIIYTEEKYRVAIETVLQPQLNHFIVDNENAALNAIDVLTKSSTGKAGFLILDKFNQTQTKVNFDIPNTIKASTLVQVDNKHEKLIEYLLDGVFIATDNKNISEIYQNLAQKENVYIISENGNLLQSTHQISGGAVGLFEGKRLGRVKNLEILDKDIKALDVEIINIKKQLQDAQQELNHLKVNAYKNTIQRENHTLQQLEKDLVSIKSKLENEQNNIDKTNSNAQLIKEKIETTKNDINPIKEELEQLKTSYVQLKTNYDTFENEFKKASEVYNQLSVQYNNINIQFIQQENKLKSNQQNITYKNNQLTETQNRLTQAKKESEDTIVEIEILEEDLEKLEQELIANYNDKESKMQQLSTHESTYFDAKESIQKIEDTIREQNKKKQDIENSISNNKDNYNDFKLKLNVLKERISIEFQINVDEWNEDFTLPQTSKEDLEDRMQKVKKKIENFGEVNPMAEEAYNEMKERYDFIQAQKADLNNSKENLLATMNEIETTAKGQFMETFNAVRTNFIDVFRSMFTPDDNCDIVLQNPEDPLESEIEIIAKPKGKRPQSINQLSGGEKTLTALSLLFGLYLYKPAPFCILDEVDAPLDDNNIKKFNEAIRKFSENSQFILVTHNKSTMASVDNIYGVTMVKQGISRVVPVDFSSLN
ncbi:MAG: chromosome segregation protein SMC [Sphingobacteriales bacterium]|nr:MAG: chromosome segregation protein SMC [Sphingobacteriales bacterium]